MKKITVFALCAGSWLLSLSTVALAQGQGPMGDGAPRFEGGPRGGRGGGSRFMGEKGGLMRVWRGIGRLDEGKMPLSKAQSKRVVALLVPWSKKPTMTQAQAQSLRPKLEAILTGAQKNALGPRGFGDRPGTPPEGGPDGRGPRDERPRGGRDGDGGPDGPPDGGPDGGPGGGEGRRGMGGDGPGGRGPGGLQLTEAQRKIVRTWAETYNPFYAPTGNPRWKQLPAAFQQDETRRYRENRATLAALSRQSR